MRGNLPPAPIAFPRSLPDDQDLYPNTEGVRFDLDYCRDHHLAVLKQTLRGHCIDRDLPSRQYAWRITEYG